MRFYDTCIFFNNTFVIYSLIKFWSIDIKKRYGSYRLYRLPSKIGFGLDLINLQLPSFRTISCGLKMAFPKIWLESKLYQKSTPAPNFLKNRIQIRPEIPGYGSDPKKWIRFKQKFPDLDTTKNTYLPKM